MWAEFFNLTIPPAIAVAGVGYLIKSLIEKSLRRHEERAKEQAAAQLEGIKSELQALRTREQILFSTLQPRRAEKISEFALALSEYMDAVRYIVKAHPLDKPEEVENRRVETYEAVRASLKTVWLLLPLPLARRARKLVLDSVDYTVEARLEYGLMESNERYAGVARKKLDEIWERYKADIFRRHEAIEQEFRNLLGVEAVTELPGQPTAKTKSE